MGETEKADVSETRDSVDQGFYSIISSYTIRPRSKYITALSVHNAESPCRFQITLKGPSYEAKQIANVQPMSTEYVNFDVPAIKEGDYEMIAKGLEGIIHTKSTKLKFQNNDPVVLIQKDKAVYKPGDLVQFRVILMNDKTHPIIVENPIDITISDSHKDRLKQWKDVQLKNGVFRCEFQLSERALLGDWRIDVTVEGETLKTEYFEVDKYVLPKFNASVETVKDIAIYDGIVNVIVRSQYTYGKGVNGKAIVSIKPKYRYSQEHDKYIETEKTIVIEDGKGEVQFRIGQDFSVDCEMDNYMEILAIVEEEFTGNKMEASTNVTLYAQRFRFDGIDNPYEFHPGEPLILKIAVKTIDDELVLNSKTALKLIIEKRRHYNGVERKEIDENNLLAELEEQLDESGIATFQYTFPESEQEYYYLKCRYLECESHFLTLSKYRPPDPEDIGQPNALEVCVLTNNPKLKENVEVQVKSIEEISYFIYTIQARGKHLKTELVALPKHTKEYIITITPSFEMIPHASIFVHYVHGNELKYADTMISFEREFENFIDVLAPVETSAGEAIEIRIKTNSDSYVGLLGVDQSVLLLKSGNDLDINEVFNSLQRFDNATAWRSKEARCPGENSGLVTITNANYPINNLPSIIMFAPMPMFGDIDESESVMYCEEDERLDDAQATLVQMPRTRKEFPETWLFEDIESVNSNCFVLHKTVPDTITSWVITGFSMNPKMGLAVTKNPSIVRTFRPFFISTSLPYSVKRGEEITFPVVVFNYMEFDLKAAVKLDNHDDEYDLLDMGSLQTDCTRAVNIASGSGASVSFTIRPKRIGYITLRITAVSSVTGDRMIKNLKVEPEGIRIFKNRDYFIQSRAALVDIHNEVKLDIPENIVPDSLLIEVTVMGNILSSTITNIDNLVRLPCGCGEQIMVNFVPNILILRYLESIRELTRTIEEKAKRYLEIGYQSELSYKHDDGSFSAFGKSDAKGSTWLTAYVIRCFRQAKKYIDIDDKVLIDGLNFLAKTQLSSGSFPEVGYVLDSSCMNDVGLTAFVLLAFLENTELMKKYERTINRGFNFIINSIKSITDIYTLAVSMYALQQFKNEAVHEILERVEALAHTQGQQKYWTKEEKPKKVAERSWFVTSHDVQITGYILMTLLDMNVQVLPVVRWLIAQRNNNGGYGSTQDTIVGLWALVMFAEKNGVGLNVDMSIEILMPEDVHPIKKFTVDKNNALMTQRLELNKNTRALIFGARGTGTAVVQISYSYNLEEKEIKPSFKISTIIKPKPSPSTMSMDVSVEFTPESIKRNPKSNMAVMEVNLPSGYTAIASSFDKIKEIKNVKRIETKNQDTSIVIYFETLKAADKKLIPIEAELSYAITGQKPVPIIIYDYYENHKRATEFYQIDGAATTE